MIHRARLVAAIVIASLCMACASTQTAGPTAPNAAIVVVGPERTISVTSAWLAAAPRQAVSATIHGETHRFEGVPLVYVLEQASAPVGPALRGEALRTVVLISARDGYRVALGLAETDPAVSGRIMIIADEMDDAPLAAEDGPYRLVVEGDVRVARSVRMVERIELRTID